MADNQDSSQIFQKQQNQLFGANQGLPIFEYKNGIYQGEYYKNLRQGKGIYYWFDGQIYIGQWDNDLIQGQGTIYFTFGGNFVGFFKANKAHGPGILTLPNGAMYCGNWEQGKLQGQCAKYYVEEKQWKLVEYISSFIINIKRQDSQQIAQQIRLKTKQAINTQFNQQQIQQSKNYSIYEIDRYRLKIIQLDQNVFYHGIARGQRPDGLGILFHQNIHFSLRGKFANSKLSGVGRVELDDGEIYDGIFRNGIFCQGIYYNSKENQFIFGSFKSPEPRLFDKGQDYPYKLFWINKIKSYPTNMIYKSTSYQLFYITNQDYSQISTFNPEKYQSEENSNQILLNDYISIPLENNIQQIEQVQHEQQNKPQVNYEVKIQGLFDDQSYQKNKKLKEQQTIKQQKYNENKNKYNINQTVKKNVDFSQDIEKDQFSFSNENLQQELNQIKSEKKIFSLKEGNNSTIIDLLSSNTDYKDVNQPVQKKESFINKQKIIFDNSCRYEENSDIIFKHINSSEFDSCQQQQQQYHEKDNQDEDQQVLSQATHDQAFIISNNTSLQQYDQNDLLSNILQ